MWLNSLLGRHLIVSLLRIQISSAIINMTPSSFATLKHNKKFNYLDEQRPLWILQDQVSAAEREHSQLTRKPAYTTPFPTYYLKYRHTKMLPPAGFFRRPTSAPLLPAKRIALPKRYLYTNRFNFSLSAPETFTDKRTLWRRQQPVSIPLPTTTTTTDMPTLPTFDSAPSNIDSTEDVIAPIFIYNGPKGELILNTMLSERKYPMHEPVPGEILYPPTTPIFRPKPIVQRFRVPGLSEPLNLTLIPFYAHEAIVPRFLYEGYAQSSATAAEAAKPSTTATAVPPAVLYAAPTPPVATSITTSTTSLSTTPPLPRSKSGKKRRHKKSKKYDVYRSADEVHWRPTAPTLITSTSTATTSFPMVLASPLQNHRHAADAVDDDMTTTPKPLTNFKLTYKDEDSQFQIVYVDESLEKPIGHELLTTKSPRNRFQYTATPKPMPLISSHYSMDKEYYAFPVYTLGKLLKPDTSEKSFPDASQFSSSERNKYNSNIDTWFIMNSRYKGYHTKDGKKRLSSKYIEVPPLSHPNTFERVPENDLEL